MAERFKELLNFNSLCVVFSALNSAPLVYYPSGPPPDVKLFNTEFQKKV